jgi:hypothetical protein
MRLTTILLGLALVNVAPALVAQQRIVPTAGAVGELRGAEPMSYSIELNTADYVRGPI